VVRRASHAALAVTIVLYVVVFLRFTFDHFDTLRMTAFDLGIYDQAVWLLSRGLSPDVTVRGMHLYADHFCPILWLLSPLYWIWDTPRALIAAQTLALALGAVPVYALTRRVTESDVASFGLALVYMLYTPLQWTNTFDVHTDTFATPVFLAVLAALSARQWRAYTVWLVIAALTKETAGLSILAISPYAMVVNRRVGWWTMGFGAFTLAVALLTIRYYNDGAPTAYSALYPAYGHTPGEIIATVAARPLKVAADTMSTANRAYLDQLFRPLLYLPFLSPGLLLGAAPPLLANLLSVRPAMHTIYYHYTAQITPFLIAATAIGLGRLQRWGGRTIAGIALIYLCVSAILGIFNGPLLAGSEAFPPGLNLRRSEAVRSRLAMIPPNASVSAQGALVPQISHRRYIYTFPNPFCKVAWGGGPEAIRQQDGRSPSPCNMESVRAAFETTTVQYIALAPATTTFPMTPARYTVLVEAALTSPSYGIIAVDRDLLLLKRGADHASGLRLLSAAAGVPIVRPENVIKVFLMWSTLADARSHSTETLSPLR
jgi:uncharacterized membrane protein